MIGQREQWTGHGGGGRGLSEVATGDCGGGDSGINGLVVLVATLEMVLAQLMTEVRILVV